MLPAANYQYGNFIAVAWPSVLLKIRIKIASLHQNCLNLYSIVPIIKEKLKEEFKIGQSVSLFGLDVAGDSMLFMLDIPPLLLHTNCLLYLAFFGSPSAMDSIGIWK